MVQSSGCVWKFNQWLLIPYEAIVACVDGDHKDNY